MSAKIDFFPVDNGHMTLVTLESGKKILIDIHIRDSEGDKDVPLVAPMLLDRLNRDEENRPYVDAFLLTHPDKDHVLGLSEFFHMGPLSDYDDEDGEKIVIREMWSSPIIFRRKTRINQELCEDAKAWWAEARRRVQAYRDGTGSVDGNRI